jgi:hypothetical protein
MTYRFVAYDLQKSLKKTFDDADITLIQIIYWVQVVANRIRLQQYAVTKSDLFTSTFYPVTVQKDDKSRKYIDLPTQIMDLPNNEGIAYITYNIDTLSCHGDSFAQTFFQPVNTMEVQHLYLDEYTTPSAKNPYFRRVADKVNNVSVNRIYLLGIECVEVKDVEIAVRSSLDPRNICSLDDELPIPDERVGELIQEVLKLGRYVMLIPDERANDGADSTEVKQPKQYAQQTQNSNQQEQQ